MSIIQNVFSYIHNLKEGIPLFVAKKLLGVGHPLSKILAESVQALLRYMPSK